MFFRGLLWVVRDCLSEEILLARPLLSSTQGDLTALLTEVKERLKELAVPVKGVILDGEETIGSAVAFVFPDVPHQLCQFHALLPGSRKIFPCPGVCQEIGLVAWLDAQDPGNRQQVSGRCAGN